LTARTPARIRFIGAGPLLDPLQQEAKARGLSEHVEFTGSVADVRPHLAAADVLVLTSETEGFPGVVLEAAAAGTPAVAFAVGGTAETIADGVTGIVVSAGDTTALVEALAELAGDRPRLVAMGVAAQTRVRNEFLIDHAIDRYERMLSQVVGAAPYDEAAIAT
jgi:glycosyltransferase involved in cell wall biosynthesis